MYMPITTLLQVISVSSLRMPVIPGTPLSWSRGIWVTWVWVISTPFGSGMQILSGTPVGSCKSC